MDRETYEKLQPVAIDFQQEWVPAKAKKLRPQVFLDGDSYCCIFGPDPVVGIFGCGQTPQQAVLDWENDLKQRMEKLTEGDDAAHHAIHHLGQH
jgi:hypothetical protein